jgi:hypothetical protein
MRMMLKIVLPTETANRAIQDGSLPRILGALEKLKPEASYFGLDSGMRTAWVVFDMANAADLPVICEPLFMGLDADVECSPVMNRDDLQKGLESALRNQ